MTRKRLLMRALGACVALASWASDGQAQYMFLDANNDSTNTSGDSLYAAGDTQINIWLITDQNAAGQGATCPSGQPLSFSSYEFILRASGGSVEWGDYQNAQVGMTSSFGMQAVGSEFYVGFGGSEQLAPGKHKLGTLHVAVSAGTPTLEIVPDTPLSGTYLTSFGSACPGVGNDNTLKLGVDWFDVGGVISGSGAAQGSASTMTVSGSGALFLGGNEIPGPWTLTYRGRRLMVNDLAFPTEPPNALRLSRSAEEQAQLAFIERAEVLADSLRTSGLTTDLATERLRQFCAANGLGGVVDATPGLVWLRFPSGASMYYTLKPVPLAPAIGTPSPPGSFAAERMRQLKRFLQRGALVFILNAGSEVVVPATRAKEARAAIQKVRSGAKLTTDEEKLLTRRVRDQLRAPTRLVRY